MIDNSAYLPAKIIHLDNLGWFEAWTKDSWVLLRNFKIANSDG